MRGRFTPGADAEEWCERRLLARIHRYTVKRLRAEIEPVAARDFLRFLFDWQRVAPDARMEGPDALDAVVGQLEGFEAAAGAWETEILPARLADYEPAWLDDQCLAGPRRLGAAAPAQRPRRMASAAWRRCARRRSPCWRAAMRRSARIGGCRRAPTRCARARSGAGGARAASAEQGASFFDELVEGSGLLRPQVEEALAELVALGPGHLGQFRAACAPCWCRPTGAGTRAAGAAGAAPRCSAWRMPAAGRSRAGRPRRSQQAAADAVEHLARTLLRRYGVVFWRLLEREAAWLPPWRDLLRVYRRLEARGDIRGGRFVAGFAGEQFALPDAIGLLREARRKPESGALVSLSGADPLNLVGILTPGPKLAALTGNRLLYRDGLPVALLAGGEVRLLDSLDAKSEWEFRKTLLRSPVPPALVGFS